MAEPHDDDVTLQYHESRQDDETLNQEAALDELFADFAASLPQEAPTAPTAPAETEQAPEGNEGEREMFGFMDAVKSTLRGPVADGADFFDKFGNALLEHVGKPLFKIMPGSPAGDLSGVKSTFETGETIRSEVDENLGTPETVAGELLQGISGQMVPILAINKKVDAATKMGKLMTMFGSSAVVAGATTTDEDGTVGNLIEEYSDDDSFLRLYSDIFAIKPDDSNLVASTRAAGEDLIISGILETALKTVRAMRQTRQGGKEIIAQADEIGVVRDPDLEHAADEVAAAKAENELLQQAKDEIDAETAATRGAAEEADEVAAFRGEADDAAPTFDGDPETLAAHIDIADASESADFGFPGTAAERSTRINEEGFRSRGRSNATLGEQTFRSIKEGDVIHFFAPEDYVVRYDDFVIINDGAKPVASVTATADGQTIADLRPKRTPAPEPSPSSPFSDADQLDLFDAREQSIAALEARLKRSNQRVAAAEAALARRAGTSGADGGYIEAMRQVLRPGKEADEALGAAATRNAVDRTPPKRMADNYLELTPDDAVRIAKFAADGDVDGFLDSLAAAFDSTNYNKLAEDDDVLDFIAGVSQYVGNMSKSETLTSTKPLAKTRQQSIRYLEEIAEGAGGDIDTVLNTIDELWPQQELDVIANTFRIVRGAIARKATDIGNRVASSRPGHASDADLAEFLRVSTLFANVQDRVMGVSSGLGRGLNSMKQTVGGEGFEEVLNFRATQRSLENSELIEQAGGRIVVERAARAAAAAGEEKALKALTKATRLTTVGDLAYEAFITNILSGLGTQSVNVTSNLFQGLVWNPFVKEVWGAVGTSIARGDMHAIHAWMRYIRGIGRGLSGGVYLNGSIAEGRIAQSIKQGQRITAQGRRKFDDTARSMFSSEALTDLAERGMPLTRRAAARRPVRSAVGSGIMKAARGLDGAIGRLPMFGKKTQEGMADYVEATTGPGARIVDGLGRVYTWPRTLLAAGDEIAAGLNFYARLESDAYMAGVARKLEGAELEDFISKTINDVNNLDELVENADPGDLVQVKRIEELQRLSKNAGNHARRETFTEPPTGLTANLIAAKEAVPLLRWVIPFVNTPAQLTKSAFRDYTVLGQLPSMREALASGNKEVIGEAMGRASAVLGANIIMLEAVLEGNVTGSRGFHKDVREFRQNKVDPRNGQIIPDYGIYLGDTIGWVKYNRLDPIAMPLAIVADTVDLVSRRDQMDGNEFINEFFDIMMEQVKSKSYLEGLSQFLTIVGDRNKRESAARKMAISTVANTITPSSRLFAGIDKGGLPIPDDMVLPDPEDGRAMKLLKDVLRGDPRRIDTQNEVAFWGDAEHPLEGFQLELGSTIARDLPAGMDEVFVEFWQKVVSERLQTDRVQQLDFFAEPLEYLPGWGPDHGSPFQYPRSPGETDPISDVLSEMGYGISVNRRFGQIAGLKLDPEQQNFYQRAFAKPKDRQSIREAMRSEIFEDDEMTTFNDSWLEAGPPTRDTVVGKAIDGGRHRIIDSIIGEYTIEAEEALFERYPELGRQVEEIREQRLEADSAEGVEAIETVRESGGSILDIL